MNGDIVILWHEGTGQQLEAKTTTFSTADNGEELANQFFEKLKNQANATHIRFARIERYASVGW